MKKVSLSYQRKDISKIFDWYETMNKALYDHRDKLITELHVVSAFTDNFSGYTAEDLQRYFEELHEEIDKMICLDLLAAVEAALKRDYFQRVNEREKDNLSRYYRAHFKNNLGKVSLERIILKAWKAYYPETNHIIGDYISALKYRNWLAHGQFWTHKAKVYDVDSIYPVCDNIISNLPLLS